MRAAFLSGGLLRIYTVRLFAAFVLFHASQPVPSRVSRHTGPTVISRCERALELSGGSAAGGRGRRRTPAVPGAVLPVRCCFVLVGRWLFLVFVEALA